MKKIPLLYIIKTRFVKIAILRVFNCLSVTTFLSNSCKLISYKYCCSPLISLSHLSHSSDLLRYVSSVMLSALTSAHFKVSNLKTTRCIFSYLVGVQHQEKLVVTFMPSTPSPRSNTCTFNKSRKCVTAHPEN